MKRGLMGYNKPDVNTVLLLHFDEFKDECGNMVFPNKATLRTDGMFAGGVLFNDNTSYIQFSNNKEIHSILESGVFTLECWVKPSFLLKDGIPFSVWTGASNTGFFQAGWSTWLSWGDYMYVANAPYFARNISLIANGFNHFALIGDGNSTNYYTNGIKRLTAPTLGVDNFKNTPFRLGHDTSSFHGIISEFRLSNIARWTSNFTPPTKPY